MSVLRKSDVLSSILPDGKILPHLSCPDEPVETVVIMGATASGKSSIAMRLAEKFDGEIISADSMQFYRGLDVGTAKPTPSDRARVPHHLIDTMDISERSDVFAFAADSKRIIKEIISRGRLPIVAGGSGLYLKALVYGLDNVPSDTALRKELDEKFDSERGGEELKKIMAEKCPRDLKEFSENRRKLIRAYEVFLLSGRQMTEVRQGGHDVPQEGFAQFVIARERSVLLERIKSRMKEMLSSGWIEEAETMLAKGLLSTPTAWQAIGYAQIGEYLAGRMTRSQMEEAVFIATRQYARRQGAWFRTQHPGSDVVAL